MVKVASNLHLSAPFGLDCFLEQIIMKLYAKL